MNIHVHDTYFYFEWNDCNTIQNFVLFLLQLVAAFYWNSYKMTLSLAIYGNLMGIPRVSSCSLLNQNF